MSGYITYPRSGESYRAPGGPPIAPSSAGTTPVDPLAAAATVRFALPPPNFASARVARLDFLRTAVVPGTFDRFGNLMELTTPPGAEAIPLDASGAPDLRVLDVNGQVVGEPDLIAELYRAMTDPGARDDIAGALRTFQGRIVATRLELGDLAIRVVGRREDIDPGHTPTDRIALGMNYPEGSFIIPIRLAGLGIIASDFNGLYARHCEKPLSFAEVRAAVPYATSTQLQRLVAALRKLPRTEAQWRSRYAVTESFNGDFGYAIRVVSRSTPCFVGATAPQPSGSLREYFRGGGWQGYIPSGLVETTPELDVYEFPVEH